MTVSIIIAVKTWQKNLEECVAKCLELDFAEFEILILPDQPIQVPEYLFAAGKTIKVIPTGNIDPAGKRDTALRQAKGEILAFLDDDAFPKNDWLKNAIENFSDPLVAAVGGPAITPLSDSLRQQASGRVYASLLTSAGAVYRYLPKQRKEVDDYPSCNLLVRRSVMEEIGGFDTKFWPGEDTKLCLEITHKLQKKIIYDPRAQVFHHRRPLFLPHVRQIVSYALHRGYFVRKYPQTSLRLIYFLPSLFVFALFVAGVISLFNPFLRIIYLFSLGLYLAIVASFSFSRNLRMVFFVFSGIILTHLAYGIYFLKGLFCRKLKEES
ncbi:MAG: glycosyltransferase [Candidatus Omnitrophica bacterium]|nr:glycosyltransferase [Candidatus Omnitrophota bacterium]